MSMYKEVFQTITNHSENEVVEFKKAEYNFDFDDLGKYFSCFRHFFCSKILIADYQWYSCRGFGNLGNAE